MNNFRIISFLIVLLAVLFIPVNTKASGDLFSFYQAIPTNGAFDLESFTIDGETYFAVANNSDGSTVNIDSEIYIASNSGALPDTGQTQSYTDTFGEDSDYTINPPSYTKLDAQGNDLADSATDWVMVRDNITGLIWEVKTDDGSTHDKDNTYAWQNSQDVFIVELNSQNFGGYSNWRMPTTKELSIIINSGTHSPAINSAYFPNTISSSYWSSTTYVNNTNYAWRINFSNGNVESNRKSDSLYVRAVRGAIVTSSFIDNGDGTVSDTSTGLMWQKDTAGPMTWEEALIYCENLSLAGYNDWRLPSRNELQALVDYTAYNPAIDTIVFPQTMSLEYWSSTTCPSNTDHAYRLGFIVGSIDRDYGKSYPYYVRSVRGGGSPAENQVPTSYNGHCYQRIGTEMTWHDAKVYCESLGGYLATIALENENQFIFNNLVAPVNSDCYIGATDEGGEGDWKWVTGETWIYTNWNSGEPSNSGGDEDYLVIKGEQELNGVWNDKRGNDPLPFICEWDADSDSVSETIKFYYPHINTTEGWQTEIAAINTSSTQTASGTLNVYSSQGVLIDSIPITLSPKARRQIIVSEGFQNPSSISYLILNSDIDTIVGYTKLYKEGIYRAAIPATKDINTSDIYISHIDSGPEWYTMISLLNTTSTEKTVTLTFSTGESEIRIIPPNGSDTFTIRELFGDQKPDIKSAVITNGAGIVGLELFGSTDENPYNYNYLSGILLKDDTTNTIYYPHIDSNHIDSSSYWWTGIVAYSPPEYSSDITVTAYTKDGIPLITTESITIGANEKYIGSVAGLDLPYGTAWLKIDSDNPVTGFELFGTQNGNQLGGYTGVDISSKEGVFAKIEKDGWTGIAFVNIESSQATVMLTAYDNYGNIIATRTITLPCYAKQVEQPMNIFTQDISSATYISYSSDKDIVGFQLNGTLDYMMLDGLEGMPGMPTVEPEASAVIGPEGGVLEVTDPGSIIYGVKIEIPEGALQEEATIRISIKLDLPPIPDGFNTGDVAIELSSTEEFLQEVIITLPVDYLPNKAEGLSGVLFFDEDTQKWSFVIPSNIDFQNKTIEIRSDHFSIFLSTWIAQIDILGNETVREYFVDAVKAVIGEDTWNNIITSAEEEATNLSTLVDDILASAQCSALIFFHDQLKLQQDTALNTLSLWEGGPISRCNDLTFGWCGFMNEIFYEDFPGWIKDQISSYGVSIIAELLQVQVVVAALTGISLGFSIADLPCVICYLTFSEINPTFWAALGRYYVASLGVELADAALDEYGCLDTTPPSAPTGLTATTASSSQINLSWTASTDNVGVTGYNVYRNGSYLKSVTSTSTSDTGLSPSTQYCYTVSAYDAAGNDSGQSNEVCATTSSVGPSILEDPIEVTEEYPTNTCDSSYIDNPSYGYDGDWNTYTQVNWCGDSRWATILEIIETYQLTGQVTDVKWRNKFENSGGYQAKHDFMAWNFNTGDWESVILYWDFSGIKDEQFNLDLTKFLDTSTNQVKVKIHTWAKWSGGSWSRFYEDQLLYETK